MANNEAFKNRFKIKRPLTIYILYWFLLSYILAALVFWFIVLNKQNVQLSQYQEDMIDVDDALHEQKQHEIADGKKQEHSAIHWRRDSFFITDWCRGHLCFQGYKQAV